MKPIMDSARGSAVPLTPRRRGAVDEPTVSPSDQQETPVLLRLPDLHPSPAVDAAVKRLEKHAFKGRSQSSSERRKMRAAAEMPQPDDLSGTVPPKIKMNWNNRIIVSTFAITLIASAYMLIHRATRDEADSVRLRAHSTATHNLDPIPSHRIDRQSFQADSRSGEVGDIKRKQSSRQTSATSRIDTFSESEGGFTAAPVSYEAEVPVETATNATSSNPTNDTYDLSGAAPQKGDIEAYQPRSLRLREEHH